MKATCSIEKLKQAVVYSERLTGKNLTLPLLGSVLITTTEKSLVFRSTNLSLGIEITIPADIEIEGHVCVPGTVMQSTVSNLFDAKSKVILESQNGNLTLSTSNGSITLKSVADEDFPTIPVVSGESFNLPSKSLVEGIKSVSYAASLSEIRPEISSVFIYTEEDFITFVSTDSFRLAEKKIKVKNVPQFGGVILPLKNAQEILRILSDHDTDVSIILSKNQLSLTFGNIYITSRLIDGTFPDYKQILPKEVKTEAVLLKQDVIQALKMSTIFTDKFNQVIVTISPESKKMEFHSKNADVGESYTRVDAALKGEDFDASFNQKFLLDTLQNIHQDSVVIETLAFNKPMIIKGVGDRTFMYLIMPTNR